MRKHNLRRVELDELSCTFVPWDFEGSQCGSGYELLALKSDIEMNGETRIAFRCQKGYSAGRLPRS
jgi:hypothetical protein